MMTATWHACPKFYKKRKDRLTNLKNGVRRNKQPLLASYSSSNRGSVRSESGLEGNLAVSKSMPFMTSQGRKFRISSAFPDKDQAFIVFPFLRNGKCQPLYYSAASAETKCQTILLCLLTQLAVLSFDLHEMKGNLANISTTVPESFSLSCHKVRGRRLLKETLFGDRMLGLSHFIMVAVVVAGWTESWSLTPQQFQWTDRKGMF